MSELKLERVINFVLYTPALSLPGLALLGLLYKRGAFEKTTAA